MTTPQKSDLEQPFFESNQQSLSEKKYSQEAIDRVVSFIRENIALREEIQKESGNNNTTT